MYFKAVLVRLVIRIKITLLLKTQWKLHNILYVKIVYKHNVMRYKVHSCKGEGRWSLMKDRVMIDQLKQ